jgi:CRISPR/Cas system CSM-associated protein Csm2 small subunit
VDFAEQLMKDSYRSITTSKLRNILSLLMDAYNTESLRTADTIAEESAVKLQMARVRLACESGRDSKTKRFKVDCEALNKLFDEVAEYELFAVSTEI